MEELKTLELLCEAFGPSGIENDVTDIIKSKISPYLFIPKRMLRES